LLISAAILTKRRCEPLPIGGENGFDPIAYFISIRQESVQVPLITKNVFPSS